MGNFEYFRLKLWEDNDYTSMKLEIDSETGSSVSTEDEEDNECQIHYVVGDVTQPQCPIDTTEAVVVHCLGNIITYHSLYQFISSQKSLFSLLIF